MPGKIEKISKRRGDESETELATRKFPGRTTSAQKMQDLSGRAHQCPHREVRLRAVHGTFGAITLQPHRAAARSCGSAHVETERIADVHDSLRRDAKELSGVPIDFGTGFVE